MATITLLRLWNDPGFTEGSVEVPAYNHLGTLPNADITIGTAGADPVSAEINPSKGRLFSELKLKRSYSECQNLLYLEMSVDYNEGTDRVYYGYIDSVEILSDTDDYPAVLIRWHVDLWRTYLNGAVFGYGLVTRRVRGETDPIQNVPARYKRVSDTVYNLIPSDIVGGSVYWAVVYYTFEDSSNHKSTTRVIVCPVAKTPDTIYYFKLTADSTAYRVPTLNQWILSQFDEIFKIAPSSISAVYLSPIPPFKIYSGEGTVNNPFVVVGSSVSPTPTVKTGNFTTMSRYVNGCSYREEGSTVPRGIFTVYYDDGSSEETPNLTTSNLHGGYSRQGPGSGHGTSSVHVVLYQGGAVLYEAPIDGMVFIASLDDYMRAVLTEPVFNNLANGDTVKITNDTYRFGSVSYSWSNNGRYATAINTLEVQCSNSIGADTFTFNNGTFGNVYVISVGNPERISYRLTTYSEATTTSEYGVEHVTHDETEYGYLYSKTNRFYEYSGSLPAQIATTDTEQFVVTDLDGSVIGAIPWGLAVRDYTFRCVISSTAGYIQFRFDGLNSSAEGLQMTVPLPTFDITSNSWSEYNYSGQRDFDIEQRKLAREQALVEGLGSAIAGGAQGAMLGGLKESQNVTRESIPSLKSIGNASMFGALGAGASIATSLINYASAGYFNDRLQSATDLLQAKQIDSIVTGGNGCDWIYYGRPYQIRSIVPDDYSLSRFESNVALNGIEVSEPTADCTLLIHGTGPLAIENLVVRGNIPADAKQYIKARLNNGVRLI